LDRADDLGTPLLHSSTYQAILDDVLLQKLNKVSIFPFHEQEEEEEEKKIEEIKEDEESSESKKNTSKVSTSFLGRLGETRGKKSFDINSHNDPFMRDHRSSLFPSATQASQECIQEVARREQEIRRAGHSEDLEGGGGGDGMIMNGHEHDASQLITAIESLPAILARKKQLETHTTILSV